MVQFINLCVILFLGYAAADPVTKYQYHRDADAFLRLHTEPASWLDATSNCQREGGVLASPTNDAVVQAMKSTLSDHKVNSNVLTGIQAKGNDTSLFGNAKVAWAEGEVTIADSGEDCVALTGAGAATRVSCSRAHPYFCQKEPSAKCGAQGNGYVYEPRTGSCYKFHRIALAWRPALASCFQEGGHLAVVNSAMESSILREIFAKNPTDVITGTVNANYALVGFKKYEDGEWATIHGEPLAEAGFLQWSTGEPNNGGGDEYCGSIYRDGLYNDIHCTFPNAYICEITPKVH